VLRFNFHFPYEVSVSSLELQYQRSVPVKVRISESLVFDTSPVLNVLLNECFCGLLYLKHTI
jgi:hypothetical protein